MKLFDFFKRKQTAEPISKSTEIEIDKSQWTGKDFEFLITGDIEISSKDYDKIMTPNSFGWAKVIRDDWTYYQVGEDEFTYSWEIPGIQMTFNDFITYQKAKQIADEVIENIKATEQKAKLIIVDSTKIVHFTD